MNDRRIPLETEMPKHKKRSKKRGQPRADHKHEYKTVLLLHEYEHPWSPGETSLIKRPVKVCMICGRVGDTDFDYYDHVEMPDMPYKICERVIKDEDSLEKWYVDDFLDKFAKKVDDSDLDKYSRKDAKV